MMMGKDKVLGEMIVMVKTKWMEKTMIRWMVKIMIRWMERSIMIKERMTWRMVNQMSMTKKLENKN